MRWQPSKSRRPRPSVRPTPAVPRRSWQLALTLLEDRVQPGDSFLGLLVAHGVLAEFAPPTRPAGFGDGLASRAVTSSLPAVAASPQAVQVRTETPGLALGAASGVLFAADPLAGALPADPVASWNVLAAPPQASRPTAPAAVDSSGPAVTLAGSSVSGAPGALPPALAAAAGVLATPAGEVLPLALFQGRGAGPGAAGAPAAPSHLGVTSLSTVQNDLIWSDNSNNETGFRVQRSSDGGFFLNIATVGPDETVYSDTSPLAGLNFYRVIAVGGGGDSQPSNVLRIDPDAVPTTFDRSGGFDDTSGLSVNGSAQHDAAGRLIRLTRAENGQTGTFFVTSRVGITSFTTTFDFQIYGGSNPRADGMAFIVQAVGEMEVGGGGGALAYGGLADSAAVKFDIFNNIGEGVNSTGLFTQGRTPTLRADNAPAVAPDRSDALPPADIDLNGGRVLSATIAYDGVTLETTIRDMQTGGSARRAYEVNLSRFVSGNTAFVGFGGATGGLNAVQEVQRWRFNALDLPAVPPVAATRLGATAFSATQVDLVWEDNSTTETGFRVERSADGVTFKPLVTVGPNETTYSDTGPLEGLNFYRVVAVSDAGDANLSNVLRIDPEGAPASLDRSGGFDDVSGLTLNGNTAFVADDRLIRLTPEENDRRGTFFWTDRVGILSFSTTFTFRIHGGTPDRADGMAFIIQANNPMALGNGGGDLAYGGLANSAAVKFDIFQNVSEGVNSTGLFTEGRSPNVRQPGLPALVPDRSVPLNPADIDLNSARVLQVDIVYDGATLLVFISDAETGGSALQSYDVNLTRLVGSNTAWVGFGGATGGLNAIQDVRSWAYITP